MLTCNCTFLANDIGPIVRCEMLIKHTVETARFILISIDTVLDTFGCIPREVICNIGSSIDISQGK